MAITLLEADHSREATATRTMCGWHFDSLLEAKVLIDDWRIDYNTNRPRDAHGLLTPPSSPRRGVIAVFGYGVAFPLGAVPVPVEVVVGIGGGAEPPPPAAGD